MYLLINVTILDTLCYYARSYLITDDNINPNSNGERHEEGSQQGTARRRSNPGKYGTGTGCIGSAGGHLIRRRLTGRLKTGAA